MTIGTLKWVAVYVVIVLLSARFPVIMCGFGMGFVSASLLAAWEIGGKINEDRTASSGEGV